MKYKKCIEDIIKCLNMKYGNDIHFIFIDDIKMKCIGIAKKDSISYHIIDGTTLSNLASYKNFLINFLSLKNPHLNKFGKTYYEARMACDMMLS